jgi:excisionase family DNA binding protein
VPFGSDPYFAIEQAAERLGKSVRQVRYLIQTGALRANKTGGRWLIDAADLPLRP